ncbi:hypothetical protein PAPYR_7206 [Paratrimastix pyriformis]|uniref:Uncharacterized protein n=1 Tax=Paratrimastix pyriformis TaxID=342808 RepID=A0ABQ8UDN1_9EUKA|nr:hypothetical protein PAPYR_7206 [Paratrimastix pyriformis]
MALSALPPPLCALRLPVPPPCMAHSPYCRHPAWPSPHCRPLHATTGPDLHCPLQPSLDSSSPALCYLRCWLRSQEATGLHSLRTAAPAWPSPLFPNTWSPHRPLSISGRMAASLPPPPGLLPRVEPVTLPLRTRRSSCWATVITAYFHGEKLAAGRLLSRENKT